ncbi:hypothetical protein NFI96_005276 [Prochilodus magdalenae]|nr:hypothetical protein NFI96_005276 [Prochilodus magdalenae]
MRAASCGGQRHEGSVLWDTLFSVCTDRQTVILHTGSRCASGLAVPAQWVALTPHSNKGLGLIPVWDVLWVSLSGCSGFLPQSKDVQTGELEMLKCPPRCEGVSECPCDALAACPGAWLPPNIDECLLSTHTCQANERCVNTVGHFRCERRMVCTAGYQLMGDQCEDINECTLGTNNCRAGFDCVNTVGSFTCRARLRCAGGFTHDTRGQCVASIRSRRLTSSSSKTYTSFQTSIALRFWTLGWSVHGSETTSSSFFVGGVCVSLRNILNSYTSFRTSLAMTFGL